MTIFPNFDLVLLINFSSFVYFDTFFIDMKGGEIRENCILYSVSYIGGEICNGEKYKNCRRDKGYTYCTVQNWRDKDVNTFQKHKY